MRPASRNDMLPRPLTSLWCPVSGTYVAVLVVFAHVCHQRKTVIELSLGGGRYERGGGNVSWRALQMVWLPSQWQMDGAIVQITHRCACRSVCQPEVIVNYFFFWSLPFNFVHSLHAVKQKPQITASQTEGRHLATRYSRKYRDKYRHVISLCDGKMENSQTF